MERAERNYLYRAVFFGTVAVAVPYLMRVEALGRHALNPIRLGPLTLPGPIKPMTVSLLSGLVALHYLFNKQKAPDKSEELRLRCELEEVRQQLTGAQEEVKDLQSREPPEPDRSEEQRLRRELDEAKNKLEQLTSDYQKLYESTTRIIDHRRDILRELQGKLKGLGEALGDLEEENQKLEKELRVAREEIKVCHELYGERLPNNGYCIDSVVIKDLQGLQRQLAALKHPTTPLTIGTPTKG